MKKNRVRYKSFEQTSFADMLVYNKLPVHPFWSQIESKVDFSFADSLCAVLYSGRGQYPYAPSLKLKVHLIQTYYNLSDRATEEKIIGDLFIKRFLGLPVDFFGFDHSTISLDRDRLGTSMFMACHLHILSQMYTLGLWGDKDEQWIIDSFPSTSSVVIAGAYRLIQQGMIRIMQQLKQSHRSLYHLVSKSVSLDAMTHRIPANSPKCDVLVTFSKLVSQAYGLLHGFEMEPIAPAFWKWDQPKAQLKSLELQAMLIQILMENSKPLKPHTPNTQTSTEVTDERTAPTVVAEDHTVDPAMEQDAVGDSGQTSVIVLTDTTGTPQKEYEKIPQKERPAHRIISAQDPDARIGAKTRFKMIKGFKTQNICTPDGVIVNVKAIPASEHDREAMADMVKEIQVAFGITPQVILGDTAYGHGKQREALFMLGTKVIAPVIKSQNVTGLYDISRFTYHREKDLYTCPGEKETIRKRHSTDLEGWQYYFGKANCSTCPLKVECTTNHKEGRTVFQSDYYDVYAAATAVNESEAGKEAYKKRIVVERKNNELKNDCGLGEPRTKGLKALDIRAKLAAIVINLKFTVRRLIAPNPGFLRYPRKSTKQVVIS
jgi:hypothetical protein